MITTFTFASGHSLKALKTSGNGGNTCLPWASSSASVAWIADVLDLVNERLEAMPEVGRHLQIGPSHFMTPDLTQPAIERIWNYSILPYLEEQFFGRETELKRFDLELLRREAAERTRP